MLSQVLGTQSDTFTSRNLKIINIFKKETQQILTFVKLEPSNVFT